MPGVELDEQVDKNNTQIKLFTILLTLEWCQSDGSGKNVVNGTVSKSRATTVTVFPPSGYARETLGLFYFSQQPY